MYNKQSLKKQLEVTLEKGEVLIWSDYPKKSFQIVFEDLIIIPFLSFSLFIVFYMLINFSSFGVKNGIIAFPIVILISFISLIYIRYIQKISIQKNSIYGLTSKRVIIISKNKIESRNLIDINEISFTEHPFNYKYGSIVFGEPENIFGSSNLPPFEFKNIINNRGGLNLKRDDFAFDFITNTKTVYDLIKSKLNK